MMQEKTFRRRKSSLYAIGAALVLLAVFVCYNLVVKSAFDPNREFHALFQSERILKLDRWKVMFERCDPEQPAVGCRPVGEYSYDFSFPDVDRLPLIVHELSRDESRAPTHANLYRVLDESDLRWLNDKTQTVLFLARSVQNQVTLRLPERQITLTDQVGVNLNFYLGKKDLKDLQKIELRMDIEGLPWFGPADLPIVMGGQDGIFDYARLSDRQRLTANVSRSMEFSTRLLVALMAVVLDHSRAFTYLAIYALGRGLRDVAPLIFDFELAVPALLESIHFFNFANAVCIGGIVVFFLTLFNFRVRPLTQMAIFGVPFLAASLALIVFPEDVLWNYSERVSDGLGTAASLAIIGCAAWKRLRAVPQQQREGGLLSGLLGETAFLLRCGLLLAALLFHFSANMQSLRESSVDPFKDMLDPKNFVLFYAMVIAALVEVGSTSKAMFFYSKRMVRQATIEKDLEMGRKVQQEMLPTRKFKDRDWSWRTLYVPATALAGDWFDIRIITFSDGRIFLAGAVCDVTGHGVGAAMMTSTISSHWGVWCRSLAGMDKPDSDEQSRDLLARAVQQVHHGLTCLRTNQGATGGFFLVDPETSKVHYSNPGHPGLVIESGESFHYLMSGGSRMGGDEFSAAARTHAVQAGDRIFLFSDGIIPPKELVARYLSRCKREMLNRKIGLATILMEGIRRNRQLFRRNQELEDDMTLVHVQIGNACSVTSTGDSGPLGAAV